MVIFSFFHIYPTHPINFINIFKNQSKKSAHLHIRISAHQKWINTLL